MAKLLGLRRARELAVLTQIELGKKVGLSQHSLSKLETLASSARPETTRKLAEALGVTPAALVAGIKG